MNQIAINSWSDGASSVGAGNRPSSQKIAHLTDAEGIKLAGIVWSRDQHVTPLKRCLARLITTLEPTITLAQIKEALPDSEHFDELSFANTMANLGYSVMELKVTPDDVDRRLLPCLFIAASGAASVLLSSDPDSHFADDILAYCGQSDSTGPAAGIVGSTSVRGRAFVIKRRVAHARLRSSSQTPRGEKTWFAGVVARFSGLLWQLLIIGFLLNAVAVAPPLFLMFVYDGVIAGQTTEHLPMLVVGVSLAIVCECALRMLRTRILSWLTARIHFIVGTEIFTRLIELPPSVSRQVTVTAQLARMRSFESVRDFFSGPIFVSALEFPSVFIAIGVLACFSPILAAVPFAIALMFMGLFFVLRSFVSQAMQNAASNSSIAQKFCVEAFQDLEEIRTTGLADVWKAKYRDISGRDTTSQAHLQFLGAIGENLSYALSVIAGLSVLVLGVNLVWAGDATAGMLVASMILIWRSISPFYALCSLVPRFEQFRHSVAQIHKLQELASEDESRDACARLPQLKGDVSFENVTIRHSRDSSATFLGLTSHIKAGEIIAITGAASSGKSTLLNLVMAIATPQLGKICIDGVNVHQLTARDLRRQIGYVSQSVVTYPGTIAENLLTAKPDATDAELWQALEKVGATGQVRSLPNGIDQILDTAAQRRIHVDLYYRLSLARLVLQNPRIVLIDELPSAVLSAGVHAVLSNFLQESRGQRTVLFVTQRSDHLRLANSVIGLRHGKVPIVGSLETVLGMKPDAAASRPSQPISKVASQIRNEQINN